MNRLAKSVKRYGVREPGLARPRKDGAGNSYGGYELIAGNRRKRASLCILIGNSNKVWQQDSGYSIKDRFNFGMTFVPAIIVAYLYTGISDREFLYYIANADHVNHLCKWYFQIRLSYDFSPASNRGVFYAPM